MVCYRLFPFGIFALADDGRLFLALKSAGFIVGGPKSPFCSRADRAGDTPNLKAKN
jgi:hypothetical protein